MRIVSKQEMKNIEQLAREKFFMSERMIVENVGSQAARVIIQASNVDLSSGEIIFLIGRGNNGADGMATARHLKNLGHKVRAFILFNEAECKEELLFQIKAAKSFGVAVNFIESSVEFTSYVDQLNPLVIVDCIFGTGVHLPISNFVYEVIEYTNS